MNIQKIFGLVALLLIALNMFVQTEAFLNQRSRSSFQPGIRYGRSGGGNKKLSAMRTMLAPRPERFELGSRYGKRSSVGELPETLIYPVASPTMAVKSVLCGNNDEVMCIHTGISNIYRCNQSFDEDAKDEPQEQQLKE